MNGSPKAALSRERPMAAAIALFGPFPRLIGSPSG